MEEAIVKRAKRKLLMGVVLGTLLVLVVASPALAQEDPGVATQFVLDNLWVFIAGVLVFFMQAGFALVEAGLTRSKNVANIMMKNLMDMSAGVLAFALVGFAIGFGGGELLGGWFGWGFGIPGVEGVDAAYADNLMPSTFFFFQAAFAATAATIVSGAMAERTKFKSYFVYSFFITALIYPVVLRWTWGGGWLSNLEFPFSDFAGSTIVHATGGWAAMMGAIILGPRIGRFGKDGKPRAIPGHNIAFVVLGALILFVGWFGFNPGSELLADEFVPQIALKTLLAGAAGAVVAMIVNWTRDGKPDVSIAANGLLAGLVAITAPVGAVETWAAVVIGAVGGLIVVFSVTMFDRLEIDDPVGAISVHGTVGLLGLLLVPITNDGATFGGQILGAITIFVWVFVASFIAWFVIKMVMGIRVSEEDEYDGVDLSECGMEAYPEFIKGSS